MLYTCIKTFIFDMICSCTQGRTAISLLEEFSNDTIDTYKDFLRYSYDFNSCDKEGAPILFRACLTRQTAYVEFLIKEAKV